MAVAQSSGRGSWGSRLGFILAAAGSAVGLGNIWSFPFEVADGGGAGFVVIYLFCCFVLCFPVMVTELAIGRKSQSNAAGSFVKLGYPKWKFVGILGIVAGVVILSFYNVVAAWAFGYFVEMVQGNFDIGKNFGSYTADWVKIGLFAVIFLRNSFLLNKV